MPSRLCKCQHPVRVERTPLNRSREKAGTRAASRELDNLACSFSTVCDVIQTWECPPRHGILTTRDVSCHSFGALRTSAPTAPQRHDAALLYDRLGWERTTSRGAGLADGCSLWSPQPAAQQVCGRERNKNHTHAKEARRAYLGVRVQKGRLGTLRVGPSNHGEGCKARGIRWHSGGHLCLSPAGHVKGPCLKR